MAIGKAGRVQAGSAIDMATSICLNSRALAVDSIAHAWGFTVTEDVFLTKAEKVEKLKSYAKEPKNEVNAVEEKIKEM